MFKLIRSLTGALWRTLVVSLKALAVLVILIAAATTIAVLLSGDDDFQYVVDDQLVNDITRLNPVQVARVVRPETTEEIVRAIRESRGPISIGGGRFSQGGQIAYPDSLHFDMRSFDEVVNLDLAGKRITVQPGITWRAVQEHIDPHELSVKIMQTYANFTVGGSLSVNVHGRYVGQGPLVRSVESIRLVLADGSLQLASPTTNPELFFGAIGGYGALGVIVEATLQLADNVKVERRVTRMPFSDYREHFAANIRNNDEVVFHNADLYPPDLDEVLDVSWYRTERPLTIEERLRRRDESYFLQTTLAEFVADSGFGKSVRQHVIDPLFYFPERVVWRNWEASYDVRELEPDNRTRETYVLLEYFVPTAALEQFVASMREILERHEVNVLNVSIRHALEDTGTLLAWAPEEVFALVVYYRQQTDRAARDTVAVWNRKMVDAVLDAGGTYYLPYQVNATPGQFRRAYPRAGEFFELKQRVDPDNRFRNRLLQAYDPQNQQPLDALVANIEDYHRGEEQTLLTVPEWYLVFNPLEYAEYLEASRDPSRFPFFASIDEYWTLYDRVRAIASAEEQAPNSEYLTMLRVIGISTTAEYLLKGAYENTVGRLTRWTAGGEPTPEERIITEAHRAYSDLIFDEAWYEFDFWRHVRRIWAETDLFGEHFIRRLERKLFFTMEFGAKQGYARLIGAASKSTYGEQADRVYFIATAPPVATQRLAAPVELIASQGNQHLMSVPRWGPFTANIPRLAEAGFDFVDISGNDRIVVSLITHPDGRLDAMNGSAVLFSSRLVSDPTQARQVVRVRVEDLREFILAANASGLQIEHIYDF